MKTVWTQCAQTSLHYTASWRVCQVKISGYKTVIHTQNAVLPLPNAYPLDANTDYRHGCCGHVPPHWPMGRPRRCLCTEPVLLWLSVGAVWCCGMLLFWGDVCLSLLHSVRPMIAKGLHVVCHWVVAWWCWVMRSVNGAMSILFGKIPDGRIIL